ncbi:hypothetical protein PPERSA_12667 [Pseudocohnilembus persalinus]|uniref:Smr domain-containing protein n=1 Tax=Pseudocohnilembus persalinus TaxID=266149 RepID=A0A0V0QMN8_PSEPJ|nr:hypothetical protein PPERSA_12667 [Pseudocohnilembus persalinus]|eukprot:KRX03388.1 hypothetical protein PPERSA_12667 [Pseudocohnilembus persalinus]
MGMEYLIDEDEFYNMDKASLKSAMKKILQENEEENGLSQNEIEEMIQLCQSNIDHWYEGFQDIQQNIGMDQEFFEKNKNLVQEVQNYISEYIQYENEEKNIQNKEMNDNKKSQTKQEKYNKKKQVGLEIQQKMPQEFPSLGANNQVDCDHDIFQQIKELEYFEQLKKNGNIHSNFGANSNWGRRGKVQNQWMNDKYSQLYETNDVVEGQDIHELCQMYPQLPPDQIRYIYFDLSSRELAEQFLEKKFKTFKVDPVQYREQNRPINKPKQQQQQYKDNSSDENLIELEETIPYNQNEFKILRASIMNDMRVREVFKRSAAQTTCNYNEKNKLLSLANGRDYKLQEDMEESRKMFLDKLRKQQDPCIVDLHGFFLIEAYQILDQHILWLQQQAQTNDNCKKLTLKQKYIILTLITGKGLHSKGKAILHPNIKKYCQDESLQFEDKKSEGKLIIKIPFKNY